MKKIFSGEYSRDMWDAINNAKTKQDFHDALYFVCCRIQELESKYDSKLIHKGNQPNTLKKNRKNTS